MGWRSVLLTKVVSFPLDLFDSLDSPAAIKKLSAEYKISPCLSDKDCVATAADGTKEEWTFCSSCLQITTVLAVPSYQHSNRRRPQISRYNGVSE